MKLDAIVIGVGGVGSATAASLAARGARVLGIEQFGAAHDRGSSHGRTRIVRQAYFENPAYIPLLRRAYALWDTLPAAAGLRRAGCLSLGTSTSPVITGAARSAAVWDIEVDQLDAAGIRRRFPQFVPGSDDVAVFEPNAGFVRPEETVRHYTALARAHGAVLLHNQRVLGWEAAGGRVQVRTTEASFRADRLVLTAGAWTPALAPELRLPIRIERRVMHFFAPRDPTVFGPERMPTFIWDLARGDSVYGFPTDGPDGVKVGFHDRGGPADPEEPQRPGTEAETAAMRGVLGPRLPALAAQRQVRSVGCLYDLTPDHDFVVGWAPGHDDRVALVAGTSGHGFKFVPVLGELLADLVTGRPSGYDLGFLAPGRFADLGITRP